MVARLKLLYVLILVVFPCGISFAETVIIDTPSICVNTDKIDGNNVYLTTTSTNCSRGIGKAEVKLAENAKVVNVYVDGELWRTQTIGTTGSELAQQAQKRADEMADGIHVPGNIHKSGGTAKAKDVADLVRSDDFQAKISAETERIRKEMFPDGKSVLQEYYPDLPDKNPKKQSARLSQKERIYIFISSSVPVETLRNYAMAMDHLNDPHIVMVMRGMVHSMSSMAETGRFIIQVVNKDISCDPKTAKCPAYVAPVDIDPLLFRRYKIDQVPAIVYAKDVNLFDEGSEGLEQNVSIGNSFTVFGDLSLEHALELFRREPGNSSLENVIAQFSNNQR